MQICTTNDGRHSGRAYCAYRALLENHCVEPWFCLLPCHYRFSDFVGAMSELAAEKNKAVQAAHVEWLEAEQVLRVLIDAVPIMRRTAAQGMAIADQRQRCGLLKWKYMELERTKYESR